MSDDVIIDYDGKPRRAWAGAGDTPSVRYHDDVWGTSTHDESALFEALTLGVFEAGLGWSIVFGKRDAFRRAFHEFDIGEVAAMTERDVDRLLQDSAIKPRQDPGDRSDAGVSDDSSAGDRLSEEAVVAFVLIGVRNREVDERVVKLL